MVRTIQSVVLEFDLLNSSMRHGRNLSDGCVPGEISERFPGARQVAFALVEIKGLGGCGLRFGKTAGRSQDMSQIEQGIGVLA